TRTCVHSTLLSFSHPPAHRALHSFPTRRSSDLTQPEHVLAVQLAMVDHCERMHDRMALLDALPGMDVRSAVEWRGHFDSSHAARSEEHTSELQSRGHLVCRLLLEKKNKIHTITH